ncbi:MAG: hypothetical protein DI586_08650 [Micavibrio aeruginosavorus]|uniref:Zeta toxin domain-containing protein n=1 Tax=Micavibrio aeruginosavorus TaxID=349221 RepID=A0A2W5FM04_9BACT|nr:MAG: hypothetical protein DI586_08650 [Micavibrio aeruginosavorus]
MVSALFLFQREGPKLRRGVMSYSLCRCTVVVKYSMSINKPLMIIIAGPNGSGKTTVAAPFLKKLKVKEFVNNDEIARGLSPFNYEEQALEAGRIYLRRLDNLIKIKESFAIETTLSGLSLVRQIAKAKSAGYEIRLYFITTLNVKVNISRVRNRVKQGGHNVPVEDIKRRYKRGVINLFRTYASLCDIIYIWVTNLPDPEPIAIFVPDEWLVLNNPFWAELKNEFEKYNEK